MFFCVQDQSILLNEDDNMKVEWDVEVEESDILATPQIKQEAPGDYFMESPSTNIPEVR